MHQPDQIGAGYACRDTQRVRKCIVSCLYEPMTETY
ncbi:hypothetical protein FIU96_19475 [Marinobacter sp. THAF39]|nr:hypothetical protein FIV08_19495 [Marinobacter sp. THAF197a]QFS89048.1 hypothetical protein FIV08_19565 [Marinobacter sp. THAF197a]QFT52819.1 hypothetical protein FIU96_19400 [Marinobacter sp. THAF39]QFT52834.1 hypothetical protein FIU96_19475 [Marinobacter sp. THAF39]